MLQRLAKTWARAMHMVLEGRSGPHGTLPGFLICVLLVYRSEVSCHLTGGSNFLRSSHFEVSPSRTWKQLQKPKRGPPDACPSETEGHTNSGVFLAGTGTCRNASGTNRTKWFG